MTPAIEVQKLTKRYGKQTVLDQIDLQVPTGTVFGILGENGAGKTTLIRILLGLERPTAGRTQLLGLRQQYASKQLAHRVGYVPERPAFHEWMTVGELGWFTAGFFGDEYHQRYLQMVRDFDVPLTTKMERLSKGMRAKVALTLALAKDPDLLIFDEPTSGLDSIVRREVLESLVDLAAIGKTVFICSHQLHEVERVADHVAILDGAHLRLVERMEKLKSDFHQCQITLQVGSSRLPTLSAETVRVERQGREHRVLLRSDLPRAELHGELQSSIAIESFELRTPSLEEVFVALLGTKLDLQAESETSTEAADDVTEEQVS